MKPKFKIGDKVWLMENNRAIERVVQGYYLVTAGTMNQFYEYVVSDKLGIPHPEVKDLHWVNSYFLHSSKEELLATL